MDKIYLKYYNDEEYKKPVECEMGPCWDMVLLGGLYPLRKKDITRALILTILHICIISLAFLVAPFEIAIIIAVVFLLIVNLLFALNYNMIVIEAFIRNGYLPMDSKSSEKLIEKGIYFKLQ